MTDESKDKGVTYGIEQVFESEWQKNIEFRRKRRYDRRRIK
jgi:hypothetical protein